MAIEARLIVVATPRRRLAFTCTATAATRMTAAPETGREDARGQNEYEICRQVQCYVTITDPGPSRCP